jgi:hypothetical protein
MATMTAQIIIGSGHPNHDGIGPSHYLYLSENSRPAWLLVEQNNFLSSKKRDAKIVWIPTVEAMLEDALLMIAVHVLKDQGIVELIKSFNKAALSDRLEMYESLEETERKMLYEKCRAITSFPKLILSVFTGSTLMSQLQVIEKYDMDIEVLCPAYARLSSQWSTERMVRGSLERPKPN